MPKVYLTNETMSKDHTSGQMYRVMNLEPAYEFGEVIFLLPPGPIPTDPSAILDALVGGLADFTEDDFLIAGGDPIAMMWAAIICAKNTGGRVKILHWLRNVRRYRVIDANLYEDAT